MIADGTRPGALQQLQLVWGSAACLRSDGATLDTLLLESAALPTSAAAEFGEFVPSGHESTVSIASLTDAGPAASATTFTPGGAKRGTAASANGKKPQPMQLTSKQPSKAGKQTMPAKLQPGPAAACSPRREMCDENSSMNQFSYCVWNKPFTKSACRGGCCFSSGKCASSSCAISGMGRDVAALVCYGTNSGVGIGGSARCAALGCKLAVPGCTTDAFGGNCVGTVAVLPGREAALHDDAARYIGAPCLDAAPSEYTLHADGSRAHNGKGEYAGRLWSICDCAASPLDVLPSPAASLLSVGGAALADATANITKNDVLLALSTLLPSVNLSEALGKSDVASARDAKLIPSFADVFKLPSIAAERIGGVMGNRAATSDSGSGKVGIAALGADGEQPAGEEGASSLPSMSGLLNILSSKVNSSINAALAAGEDEYDPEMDGPRYAPEPDPPAPADDATEGEGHVADNTSDGETVAETEDEETGAPTTAVNVLLDGVKSLLTKVGPALTQIANARANAAKSEAPPATVTTTTKAPAAAAAPATPAAMPVPVPTSVQPEPAAAAPQAASSAPVVQAPLPTPASSQSESTVPTVAAASSAQPAPMPQAAAPAAVAPAPAPVAVAAPLPPVAVPEPVSYTRRSGFSSFNTAVEQTIQQLNIPLYSYEYEETPAPAAAAPIAATEQMSAPMPAAAEGGVLSEPVSLTAEQPMSAPASAVEPTPMPMPASASAPEEQTMLAAVGPAAAAMSPSGEAAEPLPAAAQAAISAAPVVAESSSSPEAAVVPAAA